MVDDFNMEIFGEVPPPQCEPIAGKPWSCGGIDEVDRYDCIDGVITLTEKNSTACGYQEPDMEPVPMPSPIPIAFTLGLLTVGIVAYIMIGRK